MATTNQTPLLETRDLCKFFKVAKGDLHAVDKVNLKIFPGKTLGVVGESGCGKSTLGRTLLRLLEPTAGELYLDGARYDQFDKKHMRALRKEIQIIFQDPYSSIDPRMTVSDIIAEYMVINKSYPTKSEIYARVESLMDTVGLAQRLSDAYPHELDGGRRQRIGVARALSLNPRFVVCDEPVSALDVSIQAQVLNLLMDLQKEFKLTYMFITHNLSVVKHISNDIMVMYLGQCVELANSDALFEAPLHPYTKALLAAIPEPDIEMRNKHIEVIKGEVVTPINPKPGCRFATRCNYAKEECTKADPPLLEVAPNHFVACYRIK